MGFGQGPIRGQLGDLNRGTPPTDNSILIAAAIGPGPRVGDPRMKSLWGGIDGSKPAGWRPRIGGPRGRRIRTVQPVTSTRLGLEASGCPAAARASRDPPPFF
jgi:hypothetical protein